VEKTGLGGLQPVTETVQYLVGGKTHSVSLARRDEVVELVMDGDSARVEILGGGPGWVFFSFNGKTVSARVAAAGGTRWVHVNGKTIVQEKQEAGTRQAGRQSHREGTGSGFVAAPMPGQVRGILAAEGDRVTEGQPLALLEAMKMELRVTAPQSGVVKRILVQVGQSVEREQVLAEIE
jgi:acetyl-CoA/propionyl-CoA carboxylase biotin carboxyl carrier protein